MVIIKERSSSEIKILVMMLDNCVYLRTSQSLLLEKPSQKVSPSLMAELSAISNKLSSLNAVKLTSPISTYPAVSNLKSI